MIKKGDLILVSIVFVIALSFLLFIKIYPFKEGTEVLVTVDGVEYGRYSFENNETIKINECNVLKIENKKADMIIADCPDKLCVKQKSISKVGESIICLPNKVVVSVLGDVKEKEASDIDVMVQ